MAQADLITDGDRNFGEPPWLELTRNGWVGAREFLVHTHEEYEAILSVPAYGSEWSSTLKSCQVVAIKGRYVCGKDDASGTGGLTVVHLDYAESGSNGSLPPPQIGLRFSVLSSQMESVTVHADIRAPLDPGSPPNPLSYPLHNGNGISRLVGRLGVKVYAYVPTSSFPNITRIADLLKENALNSDVVQLPVILGTTTGINLNVGQCRFDGFSHQLVGATSGRAIELVYDLSMGPDFLERWKLEDEEGNAFGDQIQSLINASRPFGGLW